jgi:hypothetical protein
VKDNDIFKISYSKRKKYAEELDQIIDLQMKTWMLRNREGGLHDSIGRLKDVSSILKAKDKESCEVTPRLRG